METIKLNVNLPLVITLQFQGDLPVVVPIAVVPGPVDNVTVIPTPTVTVVPPTATIVASENITVAPETTTTNTPPTATAPTVQWELPNSTTSRDLLTPESMVAWFRELDPRSYSNWELAVLYSWAKSLLAGQPYWQNSTLPQRQTTVRLWLQDGLKSNQLAK